MTQFDIRSDDLVRGLLTEAFAKGLAGITESKAVQLSVPGQKFLHDREISRHGWRVQVVLRIDRLAAEEITNSEE